MTDFFRLEAWPSARRIQNGSHRPQVHTVKTRWRPWLNGRGPVVTAYAGAGELEPVLAGGRGAVCSVHAAPFQ